MQEIFKQLPQMVQQAFQYFLPVISAVLGAWAVKTGLEWIYHKVAGTVHKEEENEDIEEDLLPNDIDTVPIDIESYDVELMCANIDHGVIYLHFSDGSVDEYDYDEEHDEFVKWYHIAQEEGVLNESC